MSLNDTSRILNGGNVFKRYPKCHYSTNKISSTKLKYLTMPIRHPDVSGIGFPRGLPSSSIDGTYFIGNLIFDVH